MNAFEPLLWTAAAYVLVRIIQTGNQKLWLLFGVISGIGILNKWSMGGGPQSQDHFCAAIS
jgi:4-amino-4-deoxy-L-arabinose transferase-like glycosyltransferase